MERSFTVMLPKNISTARHGFVSEEKVEGYFSYYKSNSVD